MVEPHRISRAALTHTILEGIMNQAQISAEAESQPLPVTDSQEIGNDWAEAEESFEDTEVIGGEEEAEGQEVSHFEDDAPEYLRLDELKVPQKYKENVSKWIQDKVVSALKKENEEAVNASSEQVGQLQQLSKGLYGVLDDIVRNPERVAYYVEKYGDQLGLDKSLANNFKKSPEAMPQKVASVNLQDIAAKYVDQMINEQDPRVFMAYQVQLLNEALGASQSQTLGQVVEMLKKYHDTYIEPDKKTFRETQDKIKSNEEIASFRASSSTWDQALSKLDEKYSGAKAHAKSIKKLLLESKVYGRGVESLNTDPNDIDGRLELIESAYLRIAKNLESKRKPKQSGLPPTKHIQTSKVGGSDWDEIKEEFWS